jgi:hypothetical protein
LSVTVGGEGSVGEGNVEADGGRVRKFFEIKGAELFGK